MPSVFKAEKHSFFHQPFLSTHFPHIIVRDGWLSYRSSTFTHLNSQVCQGSSEWLTGPPARPQSGQDYDQDLGLLQTQFIQPRAIHSGFLTRHVLLTQFPHYYHSGLHIMGSK